MNAYKEPSAALILSSILLLALIMLSSTVIVCGPGVNAVIDTFPMPNIGNFAFPQSAIYVLAVWGVTSWTSFFLVAVADAVLIVLLWRVKILVKRSWTYALAAVIVYLMLSLITSYVSVYYYLTN